MLREAVKGAALVSKQVQSLIASDPALAVAPVGHAVQAVVEAADLVSGLP